MTMSEVATRQPFGMLLREWRKRRRVSQLDLAIGADVSARHISFVETGRAQASRTMVLRLADQLDIPLRERNPLLIAAGYAPVYPARALDDQEMAPVRAALDTILRGYEPYPALVIDRGWNLVAANAGVALLTGSAAAELLEPPVNVLRLSLHPRGLAGRIANLAQWRGHVLGRLLREAAATGDPGLAALHEELAGYPGGSAHGPGPDIAVPLRLRSASDIDGPELRFLSTVTTFGTAVDITLAELSVEAFLPADDATARALHS